MTEGNKAAFRARFAEMLRTCKLSRQAFEQVAGLKSTQIVTGWLSRGRVGSSSEPDVQAATGVSLDWLQRNLGEPFPNGPIVYNSAGRALPRKNSRNLARSMHEAGSSPLPSGMMDKGNIAHLAVALEVLEAVLKRTAEHAKVTALGKAEGLVFVFEMLRAGATQAVIERGVSRQLSVISQGRGSSRSGTAWTSEKKSERG